MYSHLLEEFSKAVGARLLIRFDYNGETYKVEPHLVGVDHNNQDCLCAWFDGKGLLTLEKLAGTAFYSKNMENVQLLDDRFSKSRPGYDPYDNSMNRIYYRF